MEARSLFDLYKQFGLPVDLLKSAKGFTINNLKDIDLQLPCQSVSFRPDYFSFLFVKDGAGNYSIDDH